MYIRRWHCEYGPEDHSHIVKTITSSLLPKSRKKVTIAKVSTAPDSISPKTSPAKTEVPSGKRNLSRKSKAKAAVNPVTLDLNVEPRPDEETILKSGRRKMGLRKKPAGEELVKPVRRRVPKNKSDLAASTTPCTRCIQCTSVSDMVIDVPSTPTGTLPIPEVVQIFSRDM